MVYFVIFLLFAITDGKSSIVIALYSALLVIFVFARLILPFAIYYDAKDKRLDSSVMWTILSLIFGVPVAIIYAITTKKADDTKENIKYRKRFTVLTVISYVILIVSFTCLVGFGDKSPDDFDKDSYCTYENADGELIIYDKMGNDYTFKELDSGEKDFLYFDKNGTPFMKDPDWDYDCFISLEEIDENEETEEYCTSDFYVLIDENGYLCHFEKSELKSDKSRHKCYLDKNGNTYYDTEIVGWDSEGNIVFPKLYSNSK